MAALVKEIVCENEFPEIISVTLLDGGGQVIDDADYVLERTCRNVDNGDGFTCSTCGCCILEDDLSYFSRMGRLIFLLHYPHHCPDCGARVVK